MTEVDASANSSRDQGTAAASALAILGAIVTTASNFLIAWLISRGGADLAGLFFVATAVIAIAGNSSCLGTMTGLVYFLPKALGPDPGLEPNPRALITMALVPVAILSSVVALALFLAAGPLAALVADEQASQIATLFRWLSLTIPAWAMTVTMLGATRGLGTMTPTVVVNQVARPGLQIILLAIVLTDTAPPAWQIAVAWGVPVILGFVGSVVIVGRLGGFVSGSRPLVTSAEYWAFTRPRAVSTALQIALERLDVVLVSVFIGSGAAGVYGALTRYISAGNFLIFSIGQAVSTHLRRSMAVEDWTKAREILRRATSWLVLIAWPYFLLVAFSSDVLARVLSEDYVAESRILMVLAFGMMVSAAAGPIDLALLMLGRSKASLLGVALAIVADLVLLAVLTPFFGLMGAAVAWAVSVAVQNGLASILVHRHSGLLATSPGSIVAGILAILAVVPAALLTDNTVGGVVVTGFVAAGVLVVGSLLFRRMLGLEEVVPDKLVSRLPGF